MTADSYHFLFGILLTAQVLICIVMGGLILLQRSEGGALGMGGGPSGFMSARGTGNLLSTLTGWFAIAFFVCAIALTIVGNRGSQKGSVLDQTDISNLTLKPASTAEQQAAAAAAAAAGASSSSGPSLADLPLAGSTAPAAQAPTSTVAAPRPSGSAQKSAPQTVELPKMSSSASSSSLTPEQIAKAKASVFRSASSSAAPAPATPQ